MRITDVRDRSRLFGRGSTEADVDVPAECTDLVAALVDLLAVEGETETEGEAGVHFGVVGKGDDTAVVDFGLEKFSTELNS